MKVANTVILLMAGILLTACSVGGTNGIEGGGGVAAPSKVTVSDTASTRITLTWTAVSGAARYRIYTSVTSTGIYRFVDETEERTYIVGDLVPSSTYYFKVSSIDVSGMESPQSAYAEGLTTAQTIPVPGNVRASSVSASSILVSWNVAAGASSYKVYRSNAATGPYSLLTTTVITATSYSDGGLNPSTAYYYMVSAVTTQGESEQAGPAHAATTAEGVVPAPAGLQVSSVSGNSVQIGWNAVPEATGYNIYRSNSVSGPFALVSSSTSTFYTDSGLSFSTAYYYTVSTVHSRGESGQSDVLSAITLAQPSIPAPADIQAEAIDSGSIRVSWNGVSGATGYRVYRSNSANGTYNFIGSATSSPYTDSGLSGGATWYYKVSTIGSGAQESGLSVLSSATTQKAPLTPPGATLAQQLAYVSNQMGDGDIFDIVVQNNVTMGPATVASMGRNITVIIRSANPADARTIQLDGQGHLFSVDTGITLKLQDIVLKGHSNNTRALVAVGQGKLILDSGAIITGNTNNVNQTHGGGIYLNGGILEMNDGSEIIDNTTKALWVYGGGIYIENRGNAIIFGGVISNNNNIVSGNNYGSQCHGGGIYVTGNSTVTMYGGVISKNTAFTGGLGSYSGGGIFVVNGSSFSKRAILGSGSSGIIYGGTGDNANLADNGSAIYRNWGSLNQRNTTLGGYDEISTGNDVGWE